LLLFVVAAADVATAISFGDAPMLAAGQAQICFECLGDDMSKFSNQTKPNPNPALLSIQPLHSIFNNALNLFNKFPNFNIFKKKQKTNARKTLPKQRHNL